MQQALHVITEDMLVSLIVLHSEKRLVLSLKFCFRLHEALVQCGLSLHISFVPGDYFNKRWHFCKYGFIRPIGVKNIILERCSFQEMDN